MIEKRTVRTCMLSAAGNWIVFALQAGSRAFKAVSNGPVVGSAAHLVSPYFGSTTGWWSFAFLDPEVMDTVLSNNTLCMRPL